MDRFYSRVSRPSIIELSSKAVEAIVCGLMIVYLLCHYALRNAIDFMKIHLRVFFLFAALSVKSILFYRILRAVTTFFISFCRYNGSSLLYTQSFSKLLVCKFFTLCLTFIINRKENVYIALEECCTESN